MERNSGRDRLLAAAREELAEVGTQGISLRAIARRAGVSHALPKHYFRDRAGLLTAVATEGFRTLREALAAARGRTASARLAALGRAYVSVALDQPATFDLMFRAEMLQTDDPDLGRERADAYTLLRGAAGGGKEEADMAWAFVHGLSVLVRQGSLPAEATRSLIDNFARRLRS